MNDTLEQLMQDHSNVAGAITSALTVGGIAIWANQTYFYQEPEYGAAVIGLTLGLSGAALIPTFAVGKYLYNKAASLGRKTKLNAPAIAIATMITAASVLSAANLLKNYQGNTIGIAGKNAEIVTQLKECGYEIGLSLDKTRKELEPIKPGHRGEILGYKEGLENSNVSWYAPVKGHPAQQTMKEVLADCEQRR